LVRTIVPENLGNELSSSLRVGFGTNISPLKTKIKLSNRSSLSNSQIKLNGIQDQYSSYSNTSKISLENMNKKKGKISAGAEFTLSENRYQSNSAFNNQFNNWNYFVSGLLKIKDRFVIESKVTHQFYPDFESASDILLWSAKVAANFGEEKKLQVYISANDLLNQNTGFSQYYQLNYYEEMRTATLARFFMVGLKYNFRKMGPKKVKGDA